MSEFETQKFRVSSERGKGKKSNLSKIRVGRVPAGKIQEIVRLPAGESEQEWIALHCYDFFKQLQFVYDAMRLQCTDVSCPTMSGGDRYQYFWYDGEIKLTLAAPHYVEKLFGWAENILQNEKVFPVDDKKKFPKDFVELVAKSMFKRLLRVFVHIYYEHYEEVEKMGFLPEFNNLFIHFSLFAKEFALISDDEFEPLSEVVEYISKKVGKP